MTRIFQGISQRWLGTSFFFLLAVGSFFLGYWVGRGVPEQKVASVASTPKLQAQSGTELPAPPLLAQSIPANSSPEMKEFLENRAKLMAAQEQWRGRQTSDVPDAASFADFRREHQDLFQRQQKLSQIIAQQQARQPMPFPPPLRIPRNASPQLQSYLTARDQLMRDQATFINQHLSYDPQSRRAAMTQWSQQNAGRFAQLQQLAQTLSQGSSANPASSVRTN